MNIESFKINNFRNIENIEINLSKENRVLCFVGENGSAKTSILSLISESIVSKTRLKFPDFDPNGGLRFRIVNKAEIKSGAKFYSFEINYSDTENRKFNFKKLVGVDMNIPENEYSDSIKGVNLNKSYYSEVLTPNVSSPEQEFLRKSLFLIRPSTRYENNYFDIKQEKESNISYSMSERFANQMPYPITVSHAGDNLQTIILDMIIDATIGYSDAGKAFGEISRILNLITGKDFGHLQVTQSPYRQVMSSTLGKINSLSQGELDLLVTISAIMSRQLFHLRDMTLEKREQFGIKDFFDIPGIVLIDEVDLHLHPKAQEKYLKILTEIFPKIQFIVTTHSPFVIRGLPESSKVINLPSGIIFEENFEAMDIDSITNIIFNYEGGFSKEVKGKISEFKEELVSEERNIEKIKSLYKELSTSNSAKEELILYLTSYSDEAFIKLVMDESDEKSK